MRNLIQKVPAELQAEFNQAARDTRHRRVDQALCQYLCDRFFKRHLSTVICFEEDFKRHRPPALPAGPTCGS